MGSSRYMEYAQSVTLLLLVIICNNGCYMEIQDVREICRWESLNATCPPDHVVLMQSARYGRMKMGRCLNRNYMIGCSGDVLKQADIRCSGKAECQIGVPDETLHEVQPCPKDIFSYLEAAYTCVPVITAPRSECNNYRPLVVTQSSGYLSNSVTESVSVGSNVCPWVLRVGAGQRINVTLMDFNTLTYNPTSAICQVYATLRERSEVRDVTVCAGGDRVRHVMLSEGNELEVSIITHHKTDQQAYFMLHYQAVGCGDYSLAGGWAERQGDSVTVGCNGTNTRWHLVCKDGKWIGEVHNCTKGTSGSMWSLGASMNHKKALPYGLLISVAIGVVLGVVLGSLMLTWVLMCRRWHKQQSLACHRPDHAATLLKPHPGKLPDPPNSNNVERVYAPASHMTSPPKHNTGGYSHIWELRQGLAGSDADEMYTTDEHGQRVNLSDPGYYAEEDPLRSGLSREHVYESPKSVRRQGFEDIPYYHEFDTNTDHPKSTKDLPQGPYRPPVLPPPCTRITMSDNV